MLSNAEGRGQAVTARAGIATAAIIVSALFVLVGAVAAVRPAPDDTGAANREAADGSRVVDQAVESDGDARGGSSEPSSKAPPDAAGPGTGGDAIHDQAAGGDGDAADDVSVAGGDGDAADDVSVAGGDRDAAAAPDEPLALAPRRRFTVAATGDILPHNPVVDRAAAYGAERGLAYDFRPMFAEIAPIIRRADLAICHLETPLSADNSNVYGGGDRRTPGGAPMFNAPRELGAAIADAGYHACSTAHNHSSDAGVAGIIATLEVLDEAGVHAAGTASSRDEAGVARRYDIAGVDVAHLSAGYGLNIPLAAEDAWMVEIIDDQRLLAQAQAARADGAEVVIVSLHHGREYQIEPSEPQRERAEVLLASDAIDVLIGHHAHVVQPIGRAHDKVTVHGLGNLLSNMHAEVTGVETEDGVIVLLEFTEDVDRDGFSVTAVRYVPTWVDRERHVVMDVGTELASGELGDQRRARLQASWDRTVSAVTRDGADQWGVAPITGRDWLDRGTLRTGVATPRVRDLEPQ
jgi:poly-gamma-glutamate capsule biosynthesis protein CapA/YwtB (metallophosphatase superfamily)